MKRHLIIFLLALFGFINAAYLTRRYVEIQIGSFYGDYAIGTTLCDINDRRSCTNVLADPAATIGGIPFPAIAMIVYPALAILALVALYTATRSFKKKLTQILGILSACGIVFNLYFVGVETFVIKAFCPLCLICTGIIVLICILSRVEYRHASK